MFGLAHSLSRLASFKARTAIEERHAADLIDLKVRDCDAQVTAAKRILASLIVRRRNEAAVVDRLRAVMTDMEARTVAALDAADEALANDGAQAVASLETQIAARASSLAVLDERIGRTRRSLERTMRRIVELKQSALAAKAIIADREAGQRLDGTPDAFGSAEELIERVTGGTDPTEEAEALHEIEASLSAQGARSRMADAGFGEPVGVSAASVLARLKLKSND